MGHLIALFGPFCARCMRYFCAEKQAGSFCAGEDADGHGVGDAGDEVADVARAGELGKSGAESELAEFLGELSRFSFLESLLHGIRESFVAEFDGQIARRVFADVATETLDDLGGRLRIGSLCFIEFNECFSGIFEPSFAGLVDLFGHWNAPRRRGMHLNGRLI